MTTRYRFTQRTNPRLTATAWVQSIVWARECFNADRPVSWVMSSACDDRREWVALGAEMR